MEELNKTLCPSYLRHSFHCLSSLMMERVEKDTVGDEKTKGQYFKDNDESIVKIRSIIGSKPTRQLSKDLFSTNNLSIHAIPKDSHSSACLDITFLNELLLKDLKGDVSTKMNAIEKLKEELNTWDKKISTLVNGKRRLEKVVSRYPKLKPSSRYHVEGEMAYDRRRLLELRKKTQRLENYKHLFFYLQTQPQYLSELFCQMSENEYTSLAERLLHSLYNHAITPREEYHLIKSLEKAIHYEVDKKCTNIVDILEDKCLVIRAAFSFYKQDARCNQKLNSVIKDIVHLHYKVLEKRLNVLYMAGRVLHAIFSDVDTIPYGIRYVAKVLRQALHRKFPKATRDEVLDTLCILIYKYFLPAIVSPDRFGIIEAKLERMSRQKENLIVMAALTGLTMRNSLFPMINAKGAVKDDYITKNYPHLKSMLGDVFKIPEPEKKFGFNEYSDMISLKKPVIEILAMDIVSTHVLLLKYEKVVFPDQTDTLYNIFKALGPVPRISDILFGEAEAAANRGKALVEIEVCLSLESKYIPHKENKLKDSDTSQDAGISKVIDFQDILNNIAKDIKRKNKLQLQQQAEIRKLRQAEVALNSSYIYYQDQVDQYQSFWNSCLENLVSQKSSNTDMTKKEKDNKKMQEETENHNDFKILGLKKERKEEEKKQTREEARTWLHKLVSPKSPTCIKEVKYTAAKLKNKGVIVDIIGEETKQLKRELLKIEFEDDHQIKVSVGKKVCSP